MKPFLTFSEQIEKLVVEKKLLVSDPDFATEKLMQIGYFALIGGYKTPFRNPYTKEFLPGTSIEDIVALYELDEELREIFLKYILQIERRVRSLLSYYFTEKYGVDQREYLNPNHYRVPKPIPYSELQRLLQVLSELAEQSTVYPFINYQRQAYGNVPLWVLVNALSFGSLSKLYSFLPDQIQSQISKNFCSANRKQFGQFLHFITKFRNVCAHGERLYCYKTRCMIPDTPMHQKLRLQREKGTYTACKQDLFALVIALYYLLPQKSFCKFYESLSRALKSYLFQSGPISEYNLNNMMGFPENWNAIYLEANESRAAP